MKKRVAVVGTIQQFNEYVRTEIDKNTVEPIHIYHEKCLTGMDFHAVVGLTNQSYLLKCEELAKRRIINITENPNAQLA